MQRLSPFKQHLLLFTRSFSLGIKDTKTLLALSFFLLASLLIFTYIWKALDISLLTQEQLIWYVALNHFVIFSLPDIQPRMKQDIETKTVMLWQEKNPSYLITTFLSSLGLFLARLSILGLISLVFIRTQANLLPFSPASLGLFLFLSIPAGIVALLFWMILGLLTFFYKEADYIHWTCKKLCFFLGGLILPLSLYPSWIHSFTKWTPFSLILGERSSLILGYSNQDILYLFLSYLGWIALEVGLLILLHQKGLERLQRRSSNS